MSSQLKIRHKRPLGLAFFCTCVDLASCPLGQPPCGAVGRPGSGTGCTEAAKKRSVARSGKQAFLSLRGWFSWRAIKGELVWPKAGNKTILELRKDGLLEEPEGMAFLPTDAKERMTSPPQILSFVSLLETHKPYLVNCLRLPALQVLLLLARSLDTNAHCTRIVADSWLELQVPVAETAVQMLGTALRLRASWDKVLDRCLERLADRAGEEEEAEAPPSVPEVRQLTHELSSFLKTEVQYSLRRVTPLEQQHLYGGPQMAPEEAEGLPSFFQGVQLVPHEVKGGYRIGDFLTFNCLADEGDLYSDCLRSFWACPRCGLYMPFTPLERMAHEEACQSPDPQDREPGLEGPRGGAAVAASGPSALQQLYHCAVCQESLHLTPTEILKHRNQHQGCL